MEDYTQPAVIFLVLLWCTVWAGFFILDRSEGDKLPMDQRLVTYSRYVFLLIFFYYTLTFNNIGVLDESAYFSQLDWTDSDSVRLLGYVLAIMGAFLMIISRWYLRALSVSEVLFAKNPHYTTKGVYHYVKHPMYYGIFLILGGSFILIPTISGFFLILLITFFIRKKIQRE